MKCNSLTGITRGWMRAIVLGLCASHILPLARAAEEAVPLRVGYNNWIGFIALFVGKEKGYFEEAGVKIDTRTFQAPGEGLIPLLAGDLDLHLTTLDAVITRTSSSAPIKILAMIDTSAGADAVMAIPEISGPDGLRGRTIAVTVGECNHVLLIKALEAGGLTEEDATLTNMDPDAAGAALAAGSVDAAVTWEPWITQLVSDAKGRAIFTSEKVPNLLADCVAATPLALESKRDAIASFLSALMKAQAFAIAEPEAAAAIAGQALDLQPEEVTGMLGKVVLYDAAASREQMHGPAIRAAEELASFFFKRKATPELVEAGPLFEPGLLP